MPLSPAVDPQTISTLEHVTGHHFAKPALLAMAVTHPSLSGLERAITIDTYQRLEFLGDRVLGLVIAHWLFERFPNRREGDLAKWHTALVRGETLSLVAERMELGRFLRLSPGEAGGGGRRCQSILADACEALIGALYLDGGLAPAEHFIRRFWEPFVVDTHAPPFDAKTTLQEWAQARGRPLPVYETVSQKGPPHDPVFVVRVKVVGCPVAIGEGRSKRAAEKQAAEALLQQVKDAG